MFVFNAAFVREIAKKYGDDTPYAIAKRTGISVASTYRIFEEKTQPDLKSAMRLSVAYDFDLRRANQHVPTEAAA
ncbi:helix-turn-helix domain-containing protein [Streptomyces sp. NPDC002285]